MTFLFSKHERLTARANGCFRPRDQQFECCWSSLLTAAVYSVEIFPKLDAFFLIYRIDAVYYSSRYVLYHSIKHKI